MKEEKNLSPPSLSLLLRHIQETNVPLSLPPFQRRNHNISPEPAFDNSMWTEATLNPISPKLFEMGICKKGKGKEIGLSSSVFPPPLL